MITLFITLLITNIIASSLLILMIFSFVRTQRQLLDQFQQQQPKNRRGKTAGG